MYVHKGVRVSSYVLYQTEHNLSRNLLRCQSDNVLKMMPITYSTRNNLYYFLCFTFQLLALRMTIVYSFGNVQRIIEPSIQRSWVRVNERTCCVFMTNPIDNRDDTLYQKAVSNNFVPDEKSGMDNNRRELIRNLSSTMMASVYMFSSASSVTAASQQSSFSELLEEVKQARKQLDAVPDLIKSEKWDSVRAVLITPPLSDCWTKTGRRPLLQAYAEEIDEIEALDAKEEALSSLRFLDMAVYNNVFNPIKTEGENGATKELIKSYYEDPTNEWKKSVAALDQMIGMAPSSK